MNNTETLNGLRVLNTRPFPQNQSLTHLIESAQGQCVELPALTIVQKTDVFASLPRLDTVDKVIFVSPRAAQYFMQTLTQHQLALPMPLEVIAVGQGTALELKQWGIQTAIVPKLADSEHLLQLDTLTNIHNKTILLIKGEGGRPLIQETLLKRGANLHVVKTYFRAFPSYSSQFVSALWQDDAVDIIIYTSEEGMRNVFKMFGTEAHGWLSNKACLVLSKRLVHSAKELGIKTIYNCPYEHILTELVRFARRNR